MIFFITLLISDNNNNELDILKVLIDQTFFLTKKNSVNKLKTPIIKTKKS